MPIPAEVEAKVKELLKEWRWRQPTEKAPLMEFVAAIYEEPSSFKLAERFGMSDRMVGVRRKNIEKAIGITLPRGRPECWTPPKHMQTKHICVENGTILMISDTHFWPGVYATAWGAFLGIAEALKPDYILFNGDAMDGASTSRHPPNGWEKKPSLIEEVKELQERLHTIRTASLNSKLLFASGNHDAGRVDRYIAMHAPALEGMPGMTFEDLIPGWEFAGRFVFNDHKKVDCPPVIPFIAKHAFKRSGVHATYNALKDEGTHICHGHLHAQRIVEYTNYRGTHYGVDLGVGAAVDGPQFHYMMLNTANWRSGGALFTFENYELQPPELFSVTDEDQGKFRFRGQTHTVEFPG